MTSAQRIDLLNIGMIPAALAVAILLPFELFLFSYAILGPLHYLTEINWLNRRNYFMKPRKRWISIFAVTAAFVSIYPIIEILPVDPGFEFTYLAYNLYSYTGPLLVAGFFFAIALVMIRRPLYLGLALLVSLALSLFFLKAIPYTAMLVGFLLPTLIHVYLFTLLFIIYGAVRSSSRTAGLTALVLLLAPVALLFTSVPAAGYNAPEYIRLALESSGLLEINNQVAGLLSGWGPGGFDIFSGRGVKIQMFIAFAYTYHYLNWFSKTSVIGWKQALNKRTTVVVIVFWLALIIIYLIDFKAGFAALLFLSVLHVMMEFPLNAITVRDVFYKLLIQRKA